MTDDLVDYDVPPFPASQADDVKEHIREIARCAGTSPDEAVATAWPQIVEAASEAEASLMLVAAPVRRRRRTWEKLRRLRRQCLASAGDIKVPAELDDLIQYGAGMAGIDMDTRGACALSRSEMVRALDALLDGCEVPPLDNTGGHADDLAEKLYEEYKRISRKPRGVFRDDGGHPGDFEVNSYIKRLCEIYTTIAGKPIGYTCHGPSKKILDGPGVCFLRACLAPLQTTILELKLRKRLETTNRALVGRLKRIARRQKNLSIQHQ